MKILFMGASEMGFDCCEAIVKAGHNVVGVFTLPKEFEVKYKTDEHRTKIKNYLFKDFGSFQEQHGIPVTYVRDKMISYIDDVAKLNPDLILAVGWYYMIPAEMMRLASKGAVGVHGSLLPKYRGNAPFVWAIINGESETGVSLFYFEKGVDEGDIIAQQKFSIEESDTIKDVLEKAKVASIDILLQSLPRLANGSAARYVQDNTAATLFPKRTPDDGLIDWSWEPARIKNFIKAQTRPYPGAFTIIDGKKITIWDADIVEQ